jgi:hypothetical protein
MHVYVMHVLRYKMIGLQTHYFNNATHTCSLYLNISDGMIHYVIMTAQSFCWVLHMPPRNS